MHEERDRVHNHQHDRGKRIEAHCPFGFKSAGPDPGEKLDRACVAVFGDVKKQDPRQNGGNQHKAGRQQLGRAISHRPAKRQGEHRAKERQEDDEGLPSHNNTLSFSLNSHRRQQCRRACGNKRPEWQDQRPLRQRQR